MSDDELVGEISSHGCGEMVYFLIYGRYRSYLESIFHRLSSISECFPDLLADLELHLLDNHCDVIRRFQGKSSFKTWLTAVAHNLFVNKLHQAESIYCEKEDLTDKSTSFAMTAGNDIDTLVTFRQALLCLPSVEQRIVLMKEAEGYNADEIAHILTEHRNTSDLQPRQKTKYVSVDNVYKIRQRAIGHLAEIVKEERAKLQELEGDIRYRTGKLYRTSDDDKEYCGEPIAEYSYKTPIISNIWIIKADTEIMSHHI